MTLTGKKRFRTNWRGVLVLQVQYCYSATIYGQLSAQYEWKDAKLKDVEMDFDTYGIQIAT